MVLMFGPLRFGSGAYRPAEPDGGSASTTETAGALPTRNQIDGRYQWRRKDLFASEEAWEQACRRVEDLLAGASRHRGRVTESAESLLACLRWLEQLGQEMSRLFIYAMLRRDQDTGDARAQELFDRASRLQVQYAESVSFVRPEILRAPEGRVRGFLAESAELAVYEHFLDDWLRRKEHVLPEETEALMAQVGEIAQVPYRVFTMLNDADLRFPTIVDEDGRRVEVTKGRYMSLLQRSDRRVRQDAFEAYTGSYHGVRHTLAAALDGAVKADVLEARVRRYGSALEAALDEEGIDPAVYDNLLEAVGRNLSALHEYHELRGRRLGLKPLRPFDLYVPIVPDVNWKLPYDDAAQLVLDALEPLGEEYGKIVRQALADGWIDVYENRGKRSGAYSAGGAYGVHPYILMNWQDDLHHAYTLAHELGHAVHSYLSQRHQPYIYSNYKIFVAEVASTVNEGLLSHHLLQTLDDADKRNYVLNLYLERFRSTIYTQVLFAEFEQKIHERAEAGQPLTADVLSGLYGELCRRYWGPEVEVQDRDAVLWSHVPHFYYGFYVYKYATGFSAAEALVEHLRRGDKAAVERYLDFLRSGGSDYPLNLLRRAGVDLLSPEPVGRALREFRRLTCELERRL